MSNVHPSRAPSDWIEFGQSTDVEYPTGSGGDSTSSGDSVAGAGSVLREIVVFSTDGSPRTFDIFKADGTTNLVPRITFASNGNKYPPYTVQLGEYGIKTEDGFSIQVNNTNLKGILVFDR